MILMTHAGKQASDGSNQRDAFSMACNQSPEILPMMCAENRRRQRFSRARSLTKNDETDSILVASMGQQTTQLNRRGGRQEGK
jgi:hypothetical protein